MRFVTQYYVLDINRLCKEIINITKGEESDFNVGLNG